MSAHTRPSHISPSARFNGLRGLAVSVATALLLPGCITFNSNTQPGQLPVPQIGLPFPAVTRDGRIVVPGMTDDSAQVTLGQYRVMHNDAEILSQVRNIPPQFLYKGWEMRGNVTLLAGDYRNSYKPVPILNRANPDYIYTSKAFNTVGAAEATECQRAGPNGLFENCSIQTPPKYAVLTNGRAVVAIPIGCDPYRVQAPGRNLIPGADEFRNRATTGCGLLPRDPIGAIILRSERGYN